MYITVHVPCYHVRIRNLFKNTVLYFYFVVGPTQIWNQQEYYTLVVCSSRQSVVYSPNVLAAILVLDFAAFIKVSAWESNFLPARKLRTEAAAEASAASEALLVIINTKSFQKQQQPQFPKEKKKELEHQNYDQFWTQQFHYTNQYKTPGPVRKPSCSWLVLAVCIQNGGLLSFRPIGGFELAPRDVTRASTWVCATTDRYIRLRSFEVMNSPWYIYSAILSSFS